MSEGNSTNFQPIPNFPGYRAGTDGSIWTCKERGGPNQWRLGDTWAKLNPSVGPAGYTRITLTGESGKRNLYAVHRLILLSFVGPQPPDHVARHLNGVRTDNRLANLRWSTQTENLSDRKLHGTENIGERNGLAKLTTEQVREIRILAFQGIFLKELARRFGVSDVCIGAIVRRDTWTHTDLDLPIPQIESHISGERHPNTKLTTEDISEIRRLVASGETQKSVANRFSITQPAVSNIVRGKRRTL